MDMDGLVGLIFLIVILAILWPILKFVIKATFWVTVTVMVAVAVVWVLFAMGGCAALLMAM